MKMMNVAKSAVIFGCHAEIVIAMNVANVTMNKDSIFYRGDNMPDKDSWWKGEQKPIDKDSWWKGVMTV